MTQRELPPHRWPTITEIVLSLPLPPDCCHPNRRPASRVGRIMAAKDIKQARELACAIARQAMHGKRGFPFRRALLHTEWHLRRKRDDDGLIAWFKPLRDGIADSGLVSNDSKFRVVEPVQITDRKNLGVIVRIVASQD